MSQKFKELERQQIYRKLDWFYSHQEFLARPKVGWLKIIRKALGMTAAQLAKRLATTEPRVFEIQKAELDDSTTLKTMRSVAEAMGCRFEYCFIPHKPVEALLRERARAIATSKVEYVSHQMELEKQGLSAEEKKAQVEMLIEELLKNPKALWD